jgi:hypothetical protein
MIKMPEPRYLAVRLTPEDHERLNRLKFRIASEIMQNVSLGNMAALLITLGEQEYGKLTTLAKQEYKKS